MRAYSIEELRALNGASTNKELQVWQFFLSAGFREDEVAMPAMLIVNFLWMVQILGDEEEGSAPRVSSVRSRLARRAVRKSTITAVRQAPISASRS